jgi:hypothetical protein
MLTTLAQNNVAGLGLFAILMIFVLAIALVVLVGMWKVYTKAGQPGWAVIVPIYSQYIQCKIVGRPGWWVILLLIPYLNFIFFIIIMLDLAKSFGKGVGFAVGLILLSPIFMCILGFGDAEYQGPSVGAGFSPEGIG